jgi:DNA ligase (NAD+)
LAENFRILPIIILKKWSNEKFISNLKEINGWGEEISNLFVKNFSEFIEFYDEIKHLITFKKAVVKSTNLSNKIFVFTGFRDAEIKKKIEEMGGKVLDTVSSKTNYLVVKSKDEIDNPTSKITKALENGIDLITKEKLLKMLE